MGASPGHEPPVLHVVFWHHGRLAFWAEDPAAAGDAQPPQHPFALPAARLVPALPGAGDATAMPLGMHLPTAGQRPVPSWSPDAAQPGEWQVEAAVLPMCQAVGVLSQMQEARPFRLGHDVLWLQALLGWATALVAAGRVLPQSPSSPDQPTSRWQPLLSGGDDAERLAAFDRSRPGALTASLENEGTPKTADLLAALVDGVAREALQQGHWLSDKDPAMLRRADWTMHWLLSLVASTGQLALPDVQQHALREQLAAFRHPDMAPARAYHLCLRVEEPAGDDEWPLTVLLQADDDPALAVDLAAIRTGEAALRPDLAADAARFPAIVRRLLWQAAPAFSPLWPVTQPGGPSRLALTEADVQRLLVDAAPKLAARGVAIAAPDWWRGEPATLQVHLTVQPTKASELGWSALCDFQWQVALGDQALSEAEFRRLIQQKRALVKVQGRWVVLNPDSLAEVDAAVHQAKGQPVTLLEAMRLLADHPQGGDQAVTVRAGGWLADLVADREADRVADEPVPETFQATLRPYQCRGLSWLAFTSRRHLGACLADDMGLGKTVQLLALLAWERAERQILGPTLLVAPMSVVGNWQRETARFVPSLRVYVHHGGGRHRGRGLAKAAATADLVITTYGLLAREEAALAAIPWGRIVLDEAQHIKNPQARQTKAAFALQAPHRVAMTGTPVENRLAELWSIMQFLNPGLLGSFGHFQKTYAGTAAKQAVSPDLERLKRLTAPFILRRRKQDPGIAPDLPEKWEITTYCNLTTEQAALYKAVVEEMLERIRNEAGMRRKGLILTMMTRLKQICDHPALVLDDEAPLGGRSGKLESLEDALTDVLALGEKALIFTQFTSMGQRLVAYLHETLQVPVAYLHGSLGKAERDRLVAEFQSADGPPLFVLSLKAGGVGLNLTAATHVIHYDRWWNPAVEDQATDRAHRIGQTQRVQVRRLVCAGTLEEKIGELIASKRDLAERVIGSSDDAWVTELSTEDLRSVFTLSADAVAEDG